MTTQQDRPLPNVTCPGCSTTGCVSTVTRNEEVSVRGLVLRADVVWRKCSACAAEFENTMDPDWRIQAYADYRSAKGMLSPDTIRTWRESRNLSQADMTVLLGWNDATIIRYERGSLQSDEHERQLRCLMTEEGLAKALLIGANKRLRTSPGNAFQG